MPVSKAVGVLRIRNFPQNLKTFLKVQALNRNETLEQYVISILSLVQGKKSEKKG